MSIEKERDEYDNTENELNDRPVIINIKNNAIVSGHHNSYQHNGNINNSDKGENKNQSIQTNKINEKEKNDIQVIMKCYESNILYTCKYDENLKERMAGYTRREIFKKSFEN